MKRTSVRGLHHPIPSLLLACMMSVAFSTMAIAPVAHAGLGDLVKSAKDKASKVTGKKPTAAAPAAADTRVEFDDQILELTDERVVQFLAGLKAMEAARAKAAPLYERRQKLQEEIGGLNDKHGQAISAANSKRSDVESCWSELLDAAQEKRSSEMQQKMMSDPGLRDKFMAMAQKMGAAQASGDTLALRKVQQEMMAIAGPTSADSAAARQKCGAVPAAHPVGVQIDGLQAKSSEIAEQIRGIEEQAIADQAKSSGLDGRQFAMARERIEMYLSRARAKQQQVGFSAVELGALATHVEALEAALNPS